MTRASLDHIERGSCDGCGATLPGWALYAPLASDEWSDTVCGACLAAQAIADVAVAPVVTAPWETEAGKFAKAQRNLALDGTLWAVMPGSPLSVACQNAFIAYRTKLHRMTIDAASPEAWTWPKVPALEYPIAVSQPTINATGSATVKITGAK